MSQIGKIIENCYINKKHKSDVLLGGKRVVKLTALTEYSELKRLVIFRPSKLIVIETKQCFVYSVIHG